MLLGQQQPVPRLTLGMVSESRTIVARIPLCETSRPPVFTKRCCKLVSDQILILLGNDNRPDKVGITLNHSRTSFPRNRWLESRVPFTASLPSLIHWSAVPRLL